ncbi:MAG: hypothetical protein ABIH76_06945 [Candidatus Bathyarchaeota archaeon]
MKITPIAFDSLGTRSMATFVETEDVKIIIDPSVALGPIRYGLAPHQLELDKLKEHWNKIVKFAKKSDVLVITHYHYDHHNPDEELAIYKNKTVLVKHPKEKINLSQRTRSAYFLDKIKDLPEKVNYCDGEKFAFGETEINFSQPVFHGTNPKLGYVTEVLVKDKEYRFIHTSDVEGPSQIDQAQFILKNKPNLLILDGPLSYMLGYRYSFESLAASVENMVRIIETCPLEAFLVDHHFLRDLKWKERIKKVFEVAGKRKINVQTAAEFIGKPIEMLEARRKELYESAGKQNL